MIGGRQVTAGFERGRRDRIASVGSHCYEIGTACNGALEAVKISRGLSAIRVLSILGIR
jgi:hypothetical protein